VSKKAHDYGQPRLRVRRAPDRKGWLRTHRSYEVEFTPPGTETAAWVRVTDAPNPLLEPYLGVADTHAVLAAADRAWDEGSGRWESLFPGDRDLDPSG
jgi:hypothetical protein